MALNIPLPGSNDEALNQGLTTGSDLMQRILMNPYDMALKKAQAQNQQAESQKALMVSQLLKSIMGSAPSGAGTGGGSTGDGAVFGTPEKRALAGWALGFGEYPPDKRAAEQTATQNEKQFEVNLKKKQDVMDSAYVLKNAYKKMKALNDVLVSRPDLTGNIQGTLASLHLSDDKDLGKFVSEAGKAQADLARSSTARPGIGAINWSGRVKPNEYDPSGFNLGKVGSNIDDMRQDYETMRQQYFDATGKQMPPFEEFVGDAPATAAGKAVAPGAALGAATGVAPNAPTGAPNAPNGATQAPSTGAKAPKNPQAIQIINTFPTKMKAHALAWIAQGADETQVANAGLKMLLTPGAK